jgi:hypothetical protein
MGGGRPAMVAAAAVGRGKGKEKPKTEIPYWTVLENPSYRGTNRGNPNGLANIRPR